MARTAEDFLSRQVDILYDFNPTPICTGTILSSYLILTLASCLVNRSKVKITLQTQPQPRFRESSREEVEAEGEDEKRGSETRYVDSFYTIRANGPNGTTSGSDSASDLAVILLDQKLWRTKNQVDKANVPELNEVYSKIYQPYKCFDSADPDERWQMTLELEERDYPSCIDPTQTVTPPGCIPDTTRQGINEFHCPAPAPGSGLFCESADENSYFLCGILLSYDPPHAPSSDSPLRPLYINMEHYLHGFLDQELEGKMEEEIEPGLEDAMEDLAQTSFQGKPVDFNVESFPYQLSLQKKWDGDFHHWCGAVVLDERTALTAAHCFPENPKPAKFQLVAGMKQLDESGTTRQNLTVSRIVIHNKWDGHFMKGNDIALVTVNGSFTFNENVGPVWISSPDEPLLSDFNATATGWGKFSETNAVLNNLTKVHLPLLSHERCLKINNRFKDRMICAHTRESNVCNGDSGGPLVIQNYEFPGGVKRDLLVGLTSFGPRLCTNLAQPSGFTRLSCFYDWINRNWERNTNTTAPNKFKCFSGQEIDGDWRCDEEFDCPDGSDEKGCNVRIKDEDRKPRRECGGEIKLVNEQDILFRVDSSKRGRVQCVWTIYNQKNNSIQLNLLANAEAQFQPNQHQLIAISNFSPQHFYYKIINRIDQKRKIRDSFTTLIFRGPMGIQNSGFHLRLKSVGVNTKENGLKFKREVLKPTPALQNYAYPNSGFHGGRSPERVLTVLTPSKRGSKIILNLDFQGMEPQRNWFDVISIGKEPKSLFRVSEGNKSGIQRVEGERGESLLLFLSTASAGLSGSRLGFSYSEQQPEIKSVEIPQKNISCGGRVIVEGVQDLIYKGGSSKSHCVWVVSGAREGALLVSLFNSADPLFNPADSSLDILHNFTRRHSASHHLSEFGGGFQVDQPFFVLYFRSSPFSNTTGFHLRVQHSNSTSNSTAALNLQRINFTPTFNQTKEFSYPRERSQNSNSNSNASQSTIIVVQPTRNYRKVHLNLKNIRLADAREEWIEILSFRQRAVSLYRSSGSRKIRDKSFVASEGEPFVIYLKSKSKSKSNSNNKGEKKSLTFSYSEEQEFLQPNRNCSGVLNVGWRHEIHYSAPSGQRSHCLWVVRNSHGLLSKITAQFNSANSQLIMIPQKFSSSVNMKRNESVMTESAVTALLFRSNGNVTDAVLINLDGVGNYGYGAESESGTGTGTGTGAGENSVEPKIISLWSTSQQVKRFDYPRPPATTYGNNQRLFIFITPGKKAGAAKKIQLNLTSVDTEPQFDRLEIYTVRRGGGDSNKNLQLEFGFDGLGSWTNKTILGVSNEPVLLYFHSDSFTVKSGFKFKYTNVL